jgi:hypothetical protein
LITGSGASGREETGLVARVCAETAAIAGIRSDEKTAMQEKGSRTAGMPRYASWQCRRFASSLKERVLNKQTLNEQNLA